MFEFWSLFICGIIIYNTIVYFYRKRNSIDERVCCNCKYCKKGIWLFFPSVWECDCFSPKSSKYINNVTGRRKVLKFSRYCRGERMICEHCSREGKFYEKR